MSVPKLGNRISKIQLSTPNFSGEPRTIEGTGVWTTGTRSCRTDIRNLFCILFIRASSVEKRSSRCIWTGRMVVDWEFNEVDLGSNTRESYLFVSGYNFKNWLQRTRKICDYPDPYHRILILGLWNPLTHPPSELVSSNSDVIPF